MRGLGVPAESAWRTDNSDKPNYLQSVPPLTPVQQAALTNVSRQRAEAMHILDRTIVFTSDNGYCLGSISRRPTIWH